jgi:hypothetical protein
VVILQSHVETGLQQTKMKRRQAATTLRTTKRAVGNSSSVQFGIIQKRL